jgi:hypothetical protein
MSKQLAAETAENIYLYNWMTNLSQMKDNEFTDVTCTMDEMLTDGKTSVKPVTYIMSLTSESQQPAGENQFKRTDHSCSLSRAG